MEKIPTATSSVVMDMCRCGVKCGDSISYLTLLDTLTGIGWRCRCDKASRDQHLHPASFSARHLDQLPAAFQTRSYSADQATAMVVSARCFSCRKQAESVHDAAVCLNDRGSLAGLVEVSTEAAFGYVHVDDGLVVSSASEVAMRPQRSVPPLRKRMVS